MLAIIFAAVFIVTAADDKGNEMVVNDNCASVIAPHLDDLTQIHRNGVTSTPGYLEACF